MQAAALYKHTHTHTYAQELQNSKLRILCHGLSLPPFACIFALSLDFIFSVTLSQSNSINLFNLNFEIKNKIFIKRCLLINK